MKLSFPTIICALIGSMHAALGSCSIICNEGDSPSNVNFSEVGASFHLPSDGDKTKARVAHDDHGTERDDDAKDAGDEDARSDNEDDDAKAEGGEDAPSDKDDDAKAEGDKDTRSDDETGSTSYYDWLWNSASSAYSVATSPIGRLVLIGAAKRIYKSPAVGKAAEKAMTQVCVMVNAGAGVTGADQACEALSKGASVGIKQLLESIDWNEVNAGERVGIKELFKSVDWNKVDVGTRAGIMQLWESIDWSGVDVLVEFE